MWGKEMAKEQCNEKVAISIEKSANKKKFNMYKLIHRYFSMRKFCLNKYQNKTGGFYILTTFAESRGSVIL